MHEFPPLDSSPDEPATFLTPPCSYTRTRGQRSHHRTQLPFLSALDTPIHFQSSNIEGAISVSELPTVLIQPIEGDPRSENEKDYAGSVFTSEDDFSDFRTIETVSDYGLSHYIPIQVRRYSIPEFKAWQPADSPSQGTSSQEGTFHASSPDETAQAGTHLLPENVSAQTTNEVFVATLDNSLKEEFSVKNVSERLWGDQIPSEYGVEKREYLPQDALLTNLHEMAIQYVLTETFSDDPSGRLGQICNESPKSSRRFILAILIMEDRVRCIDDFIDNEIYDTDLPLRRESTGSLWFRRRKTKEADSDRLLKFPKERWNLRHLSRFCETQYRVITPYMHISNKKVCFYKMDPDVRLPFTGYELKQQGGYGSIYQVKIHRAHHDYVPSLDSEEGPCFAVKTLHTPDYENYAREVDVLQRFSGSAKGHPHLIRLLMAFDHGQRLSLVFPWASGNLFTLWKDNPLPEKSTETVRWLVNQCSGLAGGLAKVHRHDSWPFKNKGRTDRLGRHGDLKPLNILWFKSFKEAGQTHKDHLVIADFGLSKFHSPAGNTEITTANHLGGCSRTYRPPEVDLNGGPILQSYDVWSLACLYLEFITWYLLGFDKTTNEMGGTGPVTFADYRISGDATGEDKFFIRINGNGDPKLCHVVVKPEVKKWIAQLRELDHCPQCLVDFLDFIQNRMLLPVAHKRADMRDVNLHMSKIRDKCNDSLSYCNSRGQSVLRATLHDTEEVPATGRPRDATTVIGRETGDENLAEALESASRASEELDKAIYEQLLLQEYTVVPSTMTSGEGDDRAIPNTERLVMKSDAASGHEEVTTPDRIHSRNGRYHKIPHLMTDFTASTFDSARLFTPTDSAIMVTTPYTTHSSYEEPGTGTNDGYHSAPKLSPHASSVVAGSFLTTPISPGTRRPSLPDTVPSQATAANSPVAEKPNVFEEK
ncbi:hypothetical protein PG984_007006, partial [Apiospora sp. TS-2023a]